MDDEDFGSVDTTIRDDADRGDVARGVKDGLESALEAADGIETIYDTYDRNAASGDALGALASGGLSEACRSTRDRESGCRAFEEAFQSAADRMADFDAALEESRRIMAEYVPEDSQGVTPDNPVWHPFCDTVPPHDPDDTDE